MLLDEKEIYCYSCRRKTLFTCRDLNNNKGVDSHCSECINFWFEWQNKAVEREMKKWLDYNVGVLLKEFSKESNFYS
ncbi:hypothetical protein [Psychrobacillus sp. NPDC093200]|uniref:hypothetical protein n=1 Tax=Psychrobacillus sp. NPDC093200 TaxID=3390656 RepID=UPI003D055F96